jgi:hypothetical protein
MEKTFNLACCSAKGGAWDNCFASCRNMLFVSHLSNAEILLLLCVVDDSLGWDVLFEDASFSRLCLKNTELWKSSYSVVDRLPASLASALDGGCVAFEPVVVMVPQKLNSKEKPTAT